MSLALWRSPLGHALHRNRSLPNARYLQLATIAANGRPRNRTVVFRAFRENTNQLQIVTDSRSDKIPELNLNPWVEICWYFPKTREQFRFSGKIIIVDSSTQDSELQLTRHSIWSNLSDSARVQFAWPNPKQPRDENPQQFEIEAPDAEQPLDNFCLLLLDAIAVDHLELRGQPQNRRLYILTEANDWICQEVNP